MAGPQLVDDPSLPVPWKALFDPASNRKYYWNQQTNTTTYDRPAAAANGAASFPTTAPAASSSHSAGASASADAYRRQHDLTVQGHSVPDPFQTFDAAGFPADVMAEIRHAGFSAPTPIQAQAWPIAMANRDLVAIAKTGSGKTCGFLLPGMMHIMATRKDPRAGPTVLVLAPTRELAMQIKVEADKFGRSSNIRNTCVYGGAPKVGQLRDLQGGVSIVIATPGRLNDFLESNQVRLQQVSYLVLDEADRMLDMGFEPQIQRIVRTIPRQRQTLFFSATWPKEVRNIASQFVTNQTVHIFVGGVEERLVANTSIKQHVYITESYGKMALLQQILRSKPPGARMIIFSSTKRMCDQLANNLARDFRAAAIHGDKKQNERDWTLAAFKNGSSPILVATDVAARGLDIPNVQAVINYDFPNGVEDYIHRIGRTGRAGATGESHTFLTSADSKYARDLVNVMKEAGQTIPPQLQEMVARNPYGGGGRNRYGSGGGSSYGGGGGGYGGGSSYGGGGSSYGAGGGSSYGAGGGSSYVQPAIPAYTPAPAPAAYVAPVAAAPAPVTNGSSYGNGYGSKSYDDKPRSSYSRDDRGARDDDRRDRSRHRSRSASPRYRSRSHRSRSRSPDRSRRDDRRSSRDDHRRSRHSPDARDKTRDRGGRGSPDYHRYSPRS